MENTFNKNRRDFDKKHLEDVLNNYEELNQKFEKKSKLKKFLNEFKLLFSMFKDYISGDYDQIPWYIIASIGSTLLYVLSPIDAIPDFIFGIGYVDDAAVMALCLKFVDLELSEYKKWKFSKL
ncbi:YkvA family protein [Polaribacter sp.]|uniref:YkvA family protein n=1 Tax=Polaribacter sp. TaxID=1920175 RepID=UPI003EFA1209